MSLSNRDTFVRYIDPMRTIWEDADGNPHFSVVNALRAFDIEDTPENRKEIQTMWRELMAKNGADVDKIIYRDQPDNPEEYFKQRGPSMSDN